MRENGTKELRVLPSKLISNKDGFSLTEMLVAILIMMVGMLGLLQAANVVMEYNLKNHVRDEAVTVGERYMNLFKGVGFDNINATNYPVDPPKTDIVPSTIRGSGRNYTVVSTYETLATLPGGTVPTTKKLDVVVTWQYKNQTMNNRVTSVISNQ